jgi:hypothetical protein
MVGRASISSSRSHNRADAKVRAIYPDQGRNEAARLLADGPAMLALWMKNADQKGFHHSRHRFSMSKPLVKRANFVPDPGNPCSIGKNYYQTGSGSTLATDREKTAGTCSAVPVIHRNG